VPHKESQQIPAFQDAAPLNNSPDSQSRRTDT